MSRALSGARSYANRRLPISNGKLGSFEINPPADPADLVELAGVTLNPAIRRQSRGLIRPEPKQSFQPDRG